MTTPPIYHSAPSPPACEQPQYHMNPSIPTFQSPSVPSFVPQLPFTDPKPLSLNPKPFRRFRIRVTMAAKARVAKKTQNPFMLHGVGKYSRSKMYHKRGFWAIKAKNGGTFPCHNFKAAVEIMEELGELRVGLTTLIDTSEPPAVQFGTLSTTSSTSSSSVPVTEPTDHFTPTQASAGSSLPPSIDFQEPIGSQLIGVHLEQATKWTERCEIEQLESLISVTGPTSILGAEDSLKISSPVEVVQTVAQRRASNSAVEADKEACDRHPFEKNCDGNGGLKNLYSQFEVIVSPFDNCHFVRAAIEECRALQSSFHIFKLSSLIGCLGS
ncbi:uncharacterized protein LOC133724957 [Rosa rugosa]|uniref:uncharacterized protein LOC133724957 n=1 Tax=Rosa rugosa TaxID=74645 RepID=UPI002B414AA2|nr:uncharacterized protein LOC133724957 [Rosa rugosa]XP_062007920.1 uncharacterized protein LOC133724957 [Rosa rugosa]XP_062007921.1 uncharacterized protein LOC133724957 [Rosa rugosa]